MQRILDQGAYRALRDIVAERTRPVLAWTGSGLSAAAGLPTWPALKEGLVAAGRAKAETMDQRAQDRRLSAINRAVIEPSPWIAFEILHKQLGQTSYRDTVRQALDSTAFEIPAAYVGLWKLNIKGVLNLNIDRLASRALAEVHPTAHPIELSGDAVGRIQSILGSPRLFIANLHGVLEDTRSWIFRKSELDGLRQNAAYKTFIASCLTTHTCIFLGLTAEDTAVGGHLERLASLEIELPTHYWITDRSDDRADDWAEANSVRVIRYANSTGDHSELLEILRDLQTYQPVEDTNHLPPVVFSGASVESETSNLPAPAELQGWNAEAIRRVLNAHAKALLDSTDEEDAYKQFNVFADQYDEAIYRAWYTSTSEGQNTLLGYELNRYVAQGAFGKVFEATTPNGSRVAVKVLLEEVRRDPAMLRSFRRGVKSMAILGRHRMHGMVAYIDASEIPAFVSMDWVDGPNLAEAVDSRLVEEWDIVLRIGSDLARIIRSAHGLPERVLHRDLRPANIMLRDYYVDPTDWQVVVLDFDLSWHRGATDASVFRSSAVGYLAPEQVIPKKGASTRNAAVDSFGLGMTLYFMVARIDPASGQHRSAAWEHDIFSSVASRPCHMWRSTPKRYARLVLAATAERQSERPDMAEIDYELSRLREAVLSPDRVTAIDLLVEEVAASADVMQDYSWDSEQSIATASLPSGLVLCLSSDETVGDGLRLTVDWASRGDQDRARLSRYLTDATGEAERILRTVGWKVPKAKSARRAVRIEATLDARMVVGETAKVARGLDRGLAMMRDVTRRV
jgi:serine/threonine protein kinase